MMARLLLIPGGDLYELGADDLQPIANDWEQYTVAIHSGDNQVELAGSLEQLEAVAHNIMAMTASERARAATETDEDPI